MVLEKAFTHPYTWHSLMGSANNAAIKISKMQVPTASQPLTVGSLINVTHCF